MYIIGTSGTIYQESLLIQRASKIKELVKEAKRQLSELRKTFTDKESIKEQGYMADELSTIERFI